MKLLILLLISINSFAANSPIIWNFTCGSGAYNLASNSCLSTGGGTVTDVTASSPLFSSGGATPNLTCQASSGSQNGCLSSTDWTTFNSKEPAITSGTTSQYWRGDKTFQSLSTAIKSEVKTDVTALIIYVSKDVGNDSTGDGSFLKPFATIQKGIDTATAIPSTYNTPIEIVVTPSASGAGYTENLSITQQGILLHSSASVLGRSDLVTIFGTVTVNLTGTAGGGNFTASQNNFYMFGFQIAPSGANKAIVFSGTTYQRLFISNSLIGQTGTDNAISATNSGSSGGSFSTITIRDCDIENNSGSNATINQTAGKIFIAGSNPSITNSTSGGVAINTNGNANTNITLNNGSVTGLYTNGGTGASTFTNTAFTGATTGAILAVTSTGSLTLGVDSVTNTTSTGSGISNAGGTVTIIQDFFNIGTGSGAYVVKGTGVLLHALNAYLTNKNFQNTLTILAVATTPTTGP